MSGMLSDSLPAQSLPEFLPAMLLPGVALFPHALVPLYIFEPRYRRMLEDALESDRLFCIAMPKNPERPPSALEEIHGAGGAGMVRACVRNGDGTSHLILQGAARVRFTALKLDGPYPVVGIERIRPSNSTSLMAFTHMERVAELVGEASRKELPVTPQLEQCVRSLEEPEAVADLVAGSLIADPLERLWLLEEPNTVERLVRIENYLEKALADA